MAKQQAVLQAQFFCARLCSEQKLRGSCPNFPRIKIKAQAGEPQAGLCFEEAASGSTKKTQTTNHDHKKSTKNTQKTHTHTNKKAQTTNHDPQKHKKSTNKSTNYHLRPQKKAQKKAQTTNHDHKSTKKHKKNTKNCILEHNFFPPNRAVLNMKKPLRGSPAGPEPLTLNPITLNPKPTDFRAVGRRFVLRPMSGLIFALRLQHPRSRGATGQCGPKYGR